MVFTCWVNFFNLCSVAETGLSSIKAIFVRFLYLHCPVVHIIHNYPVFRVRGKWDLASTESGFWSPYSGLCYRSLLQVDGKPC